VQVPPQSLTTEGLYSSAATLQPQHQLQPAHAGATFTPASGATLQSAPLIGPNAASNLGQCLQVAVNPQVSLVTAFVLAKYCTHSRETYCLFTFLLQIQICIDSAFFVLLDPAKVPYPCKKTT